MLLSILTYDRLQHVHLRGLRKRTWRDLNYLEKAFYRASLWYSKCRCIVNRELVAKLSAVLEKLQETRGICIFKRGLVMAAVLLQCLENSLSDWLSEPKEWLKDPDYICWLGMLRGNFFSLTMVRRCEH